MAGRPAFALVGGRDVHADRRPFLLARAASPRRCGPGFGEQGFVEVETGDLAGVARQ